MIPKNVNQGYWNKNNWAWYLCSNKQEQGVALLIIRAQCLAHALIKYLQAQVLFAGPYQTESNGNRTRSHYTRSDEIRANKTGLDRTGSASTAWLLLIVLVDQFALDSKVWNWGTGHRSVISRFTGCEWSNPKTRVRYNLFVPHPTNRFSQTWSNFTSKETHLCHGTVTAQEVSTW